MELLDTSLASESAEYSCNGPAFWTVTGDLGSGVIMFQLDVGGGFATALVVSDETIKAGKLDLPYSGSLKAVALGNYGDCLVSLIDEA